MYFLTCHSDPSSSPKTGKGGPDVGEVLADQPVLHPGHGLWRPAELRTFLAAKVGPEEKQIREISINPRHWPEIHQVITPPDWASLVRVSKYPRASENSGNTTIRYRRRSGERNVPVVPVLSLSRKISIARQNTQDLAEVSLNAALDLVKLNTNIILFSYSEIWYLPLLLCERKCMQTLDSLVTIPWKCGSNVNRYLGI